MKYVFTILFFFFAAVMPAQTLLFQNGYDGAGDDLFMSVALCSDGGYIAAGSTQSSGGGEDIFLARLDANGNLLWTKTIGTPADETASGVSALPGGGFMIAGVTSGYSVNNDDDVLVVCTDAAGQVVWSATYGDTTSEQVCGITPAGAGRFVIAGSGYSSVVANSRESMLLCVDSLGNISWTLDLGGMWRDDISRDVTVLPGGNLMVAGEINDFLAISGFIEKVSADGNLLWHKRADGPQDDQLQAIAYGGRGACMAAGTTNSFGAGLTDIFLVRADTGAPAMSFLTIGTPGADYAYDICATSDNGYLITGATTLTAQGLFEPFLLKIDSAEAIQWSFVYGTYLPDAAFSCITSGNHAVIAGYSYGLSSGNNLAAYLARTDASGNADCNFTPVTFTVDTNGAMYLQSMPQQFTSYPLVPRSFVSQPVTALATNAICPNSVHETMPASFAIFPQPCSEQFSFAGELPPGALLELLDVNGKSVKQFRMQPAYDVSDLSPGVYSWNVTSTHQHGKLIIAR